MSSSALSSLERRAAFSLASIFSMRMLGLFMIYPVFSLYADQLPGATAFTIGLALGIYGLAQAIFQFPFGIWSDKVGRRKVITVGLLLFAAGSVVAAMSDSIWGVVIGRALQGTGAVGAVILALMADLTRERQRTRAMAIIGVSIGLSFALGLIIGPVLDHWFQLSGIFWVTALMALAGLLVLYFAVPEPPPQRLHRDTEAIPSLLKDVLKNTQLVRLDIGIFLQHAILTATFLGVPLLLKQDAAGGIESTSLFYLVALLVSIALMVPLIIYGERHKRLKRLFVMSIIAIGLVQLLFASGTRSLWLLVPAIVVFFTAFNLLESILPSFVSRVAPAGMKGTAMGVYSSSQFLGIFVGGALGGLIQQHGDVHAVFVFAMGLAVIWLLATIGLRDPGHQSTQTLSLRGLNGVVPMGLRQQMMACDGVLDVVLALEDESVIVKVDTRYFDEATLVGLLKTTPINKNPSGL